MQKTSMKKHARDDWHQGLFQRVAVPGNSLLNVVGSERIASNERIRCFWWQGNLMSEHGDVRRDQQERDNREALAGRQVL